MAWSPLHDAALPKGLRLSGPLRRHGMPAKELRSARCGRMAWWTSDVLLRSQLLRVIQLTVYLTEMAIDGRGTSLGD